MFFSHNMIPLASRFKLINLPGIFKRIKHSIHQS